MTTLFLAFFRSGRRPTNRLAWGVMHYATQPGTTPRRKAAPFRATAACVMVVFLGANLGVWAASPEYAVVVSHDTLGQSGWKAVVEALVTKYQATVISYGTSVQNSLPELRRQFPRCACFVARPEEVSREFVSQVHRLTRQFDDDPYTDCFWGILTGYDATNALWIASQQAPLTVQKVASGTELAMDCIEEGVWYCELNQNKMVQKERNQKARILRGPDDTTQALAEALNQGQPDLFVASGHATERDWMIGFRYRNGFFKCENGRLFGLDTQGQRWPIDSPNPKVYLPVGNCLMGHITGRDCMALAWMRSAGVCQMAGYTVPTWYGYMGWGLLDYFVEEPGRYTLAEAFIANQHALMHRLVTFFPELARAEADPNRSSSTPIQVGARAKAAGLNANDGRGLLYDRDVVAFYGDPAWQARMAVQPRAFDQTLTETNGLFTFEIKPNRGAQSFDPVNRNGSQRGGRPFIAYLPHRIGTAQVREGLALEPVITDDFVLVPNPGQCDPAKTYRVVFAARAVQ